MFFSRKTPAQAFWTWFEKNEARIHDYERNQAAVFAALTAELHRIDAELAFEFGPKDERGQRELVLSAGGIKASFRGVQALVDAAPRLPRWRFTAFRPRRKPLMTLVFKDLTISPEDVDCCVLSNGRQLGLYLFFHGWSEERKNDFGQMGYLMLDEAIGEYDVAMKVGPIQFKAFEEHPDVERFPLTALAERFDAHYVQLLQ
jgi:hypothetical protein